MTAYETISLRDLCQLAPGPSSALLENLHDGPDGVPVISPPDITDEHGVDPVRMRRVPWDDLDKMSRFVLRKGDILYVRQGALGRLALVTATQVGWIYNSSLLRLRPRNAVVLPAYLAAFLFYEPTRNIVLGQAQQGTVPSLNIAQFQELGVIVPPMRQQHAIVDTIADFDSNIKIHRAIADRLDALSEAVFSDMVQGREPT